MIDLGTIGGAVTTVVFGGGAALAVIRLNMRGAFATVAALRQLTERVDTMEQQLASAPKHVDLAQMTTRLGVVERGVGVMEATLNGVRDSVRRVEHMTDLLLKHQIDGEARDR